MTFEDVKIQMGAAKSEICSVTPFSMAVESLYDIPDNTQKSVNHQEEIEEFSNEYESKFDITIETDTVRVSRPKKS